MRARKFASVTDQATERLREGMVEGRWRDKLPGREQLAAELGCSEWTVKQAMKRLTKEGLLVSPGPGHRQRIVLSEGGIKPSALRVGILLYERIEAKVDYIVDLQHLLLEAGHVATVPRRALLDLKMDVGRISQLVKGTEADAWVIQAGSSAVLKWFSEQSVPAFALAGRRRKVPIAGTGPDKVPALRTALRRLAELGHRRIVMIAREERRKPNVGLIEQSFLDELAALGIATGPYNLPGWDDSPDGLHQRIDSLIVHRPPTALIVGEAPLFLAVERHLSRRGLLSPRDVSLLCLDPSPVFKWFRPSVTHVNWDSRPMIKRIIKWADNVARGKDDRRQTSTKAEFVEGGTIGAVPP